MCQLLKKPVIKAFKEESFLQTTLEFKSSFNNVNEGLLLYHFILVVLQFLS